MKLNLNEFLPKLNLANAVINPKAVIPIQGEFLLRTENGMLYVNASDGENTVSIRVKPTECTDLCVCVNANDFFKALSNLRGEEITIVLNEEKHLMRCQYNSGYFQIPYDYDPMASAVLEIQPEEHHIEKTVDMADLSEAVGKAEIAADDTNVRPQFNSVYFDFKADGMVVVATDATRMSKFKTNITSESDMQGFTIQKKGAHILTSLMTNCDGETVNMKVGGKSVLFSNDDFIMSVRLTEGEYPNYDILIPEGNNLRAIINRDMVLNAVKRVAPMGNEKEELLKMTFGDNAVIIEAEDRMFSKLAKEKIACKYNGELITMGVNSRNVVTLIQAMDCEDVEFSFRDSKTPMVIKPQSDLKECFTTLVMPLVLK